MISIIENLPLYGSVLYISIRLPYKAYQVITNPELTAEMLKVTCTVKGKGITQYPGMIFTFNTYHILYPYTYPISLPFTLTVLLPNTLPLLAYCYPFTVTLSHIPFLYPLPLPSTLSLTNPYPFSGLLPHRPPIPDGSCPFSVYYEQVRDALDKADAVYQTFHATVRENTFQSYVYKKI